MQEPLENNDNAFERHNNGASDDSEGIKEDSLCQVCLFRQGAGMLALVPCGHARFCQPCLNRLNHMT